MLLGNRPSYLALHNKTEQKVRSVEITTTLSQVLRNWTPGTRISPIWGVTEFETTKPVSSQFQGKNHLLFIGPGSPERLYSEVEALRREPTARLWISLGTYNTIINIERSRRGTRAVQQILNWAQEESVCFEKWLVTNGTIETAYECFCNPKKCTRSLQKVARIANKTHAPEITAHIQEFCTLISSSLTRSSAYNIGCHEDLIVFLDIVDELISAAVSGQRGLLETQADLISINAALSRFSSQAFSGTTPITATECHFWIHSLLGTGTANKALNELVTYVSSTIGNARIPQRFQLLASMQSDAPTYKSLTSDPTLIDRDILGETSDPDHQQPISPLISYFSGRDGFSSHLQTVSAPLSTVSQCNSYSSNLLTLTHELGHIFAHSVFAEIYPDINDDNQISSVLNAIQPNHEPSNWLEAAQKLLIESLISMEQAELGRALYPSAYDATFTRYILYKWRREAQEIVVHTFDFLYFYNDFPDFYIESIWHSWGAIHGIKDRVPEYVMRTLCAISSKLLKENPNNQFPTAIKSLTETLAKVAKHDAVSSEYAQEALDHLDSTFRDVINKKLFIERYSARLYLVRLTHIFLYSQTIAAQFYGEPYVESGDRQSKRRLELDQRPISNPLRFLRDHLKEKPTEAESLWVLLNLAYNVDVPHGGEP